MIRFKRIKVDAASAWLNAYFDALSSPIESFLEEHIFESNLYEIIFDGDAIGITGIYNASLMTLFFVPDQYKRLGQKAFFDARRLEQVKEAFVPTCDEYFLSVAIESARDVKPQAYFFHDLLAEGVAYANASTFAIRQATADDAAFIEAESADFFAPIGERIGRNELFIASVALPKQAVTPVAIGIQEHSRIKPAITSVGMYVLEAQRQKGYGTQTIRALINHCHEHDRTAVAGCYFYNHNSKKTLERAGMMTRTRLLRVGL